MDYNLFFGCNSKSIGRSITKLQLILWSQYYRKQNSWSRHFERITHVPDFHTMQNAESLKMMEIGRHYNGCKVKIPPIHFRHYDIDNTFGLLKCCFHRDKNKRKLLLCTQMLFRLKVYFKRFSVSINRQEHKKKDNILWTCLNRQFERCRQYSLCPFGFRLSVSCTSNLKIILYFTISVFG